MTILEQMRLARGWSKSELARRARIAAADVGKIESRRLLPYHSQLRKLAKALGIAVQDAPTLTAEFTGTERVPNLSPEQR